MTRRQRRRNLTDLLRSEVQQNTSGISPAATPSEEPAENLGSEVEPTIADPLPEPDPVTPVADDRSAEIAQLQEAIAAKDRAFQTLEKEHKKVTKELSTLRQALEQEKARVVQLQGEIAELQAAAVPAQKKPALPMVMPPQPPLYVHLSIYERLIAPNRTNNLNSDDIGWFD